MPSHIHKLLLAHFGTEPCLLKLPVRLLKDNRQDQTPHEMDAYHP